MHRQCYILIFKLFVGDDVDESSNNLSIKSIGITPDKSEKEDIYAKVVNKKLCIDTLDI